MISIDKEIMKCVTISIREVTEEPNVPVGEWVSIMPPPLHKASLVAVDAYPLDNKAIEFIATRCALDHYISTLEAVEPETDALKHHLYDVMGDKVQSRFMGVISNPRTEYAPTDRGGGPATFGRPHFPYSGAPRGKLFIATPAMIISLINISTDVANVRAKVWVAVIGGIA